MVTDVSSEHPDGSATSGASAPAWAEELLEVLAARRQLLVAAAVGLSLLGILAAIVLPGFVPPRPLVGAAVGVAVVLLSVAITVAADSADLTLRGARHVRAAGGHVAATLPMGARFDEADGLAASIDARAEVGGRHWVALAPASRDLRGISDWADALGVCLSRRDRRVVVIDLYSGSTPGRAGVLEVVRDEVRLARAVDFDRELMLARLGAGEDALSALEALPGLVPRLPRDIEILVVALPPLGQPGALSVAGTLDRVLVFAETDVTSRVDLIASLDALDATDTASEVVLLEPARRTRAAAMPVDEPVVDEQPSDEASEPEPSDEPLQLDDAPVDAAAEAEPIPPLPTPEPDVVSDGTVEDAADDHLRAGTPLVRDMAADEAAEPDVDPAPPVPSPSDDDLPAATVEQPAVEDAPAPEPTPTPDLPEPGEHTFAVEELDDEDGDLAAAAALHQVAAGAETVQEQPTTPEPAASPFARPTEDAEAEPAHTETEEILPEPIRDAVPAVDPQDQVADEHELRDEPTVDDRRPSTSSEGNGNGNGHHADGPRPVPAATLTQDAGDHIAEAGRWAAPNGHEILTGASLDRPHHDEDDDPLRVAAALQSLAAEVWSRDDERP